ncbi:hypothetical protein Chor_004246 [Crotalus horridus]
MTPSLHPKQAKVEKAVALQHPENGEHAAVSQGIRVLQTAAAGGGEGAATPLGQTPGSRGSKHQASRQAYKQEEDPERMKHRRKQKTPKKFTGEQPSISGTFGLKASPEEQWQRTINEKGEVACPTCGMITRKTVLGLKKHMEVCQKGCTATFSSLMGYQYHQKRCGKQPSEVEKPVFACPHCGKAYKSKAGHDYHIRSEHPAMPPEQPEAKPEPSPVVDFERTPSGRIRRTSAQVAVFHLQEIAEDELAKDWTKRRMKDDLVPETKQLNYTRPGLPKLNPSLLEAWKNEVKEKGHINCPNDNWFHTSADSSKKKKSKEQGSPGHEEQKTSPDGRKRGRKPKERHPEFFPKDTESLLENTNHKKAAASWPVANCILDEKDRGNKPFHAKKAGANKMAEK